MFIKWMLSFTVKFWGTWTFIWTVIWTKNRICSIICNIFMWKSRNLFIEYLVRGGAEEKKMVPKENFCGWFICGQHCAKPTHQYNRKGSWLFLVKKGCSLEIKLEIHAKFNLQFILFFCYTTKKFRMLNSIRHFFFCCEIVISTLRI